LGSNLVPVPGVPRIYGPNFSPAALPREHPLIRPAAARTAARANDPGALRRLICQKLCAISVGPAPGNQLEAGGHG
jgi:hypothetical protein